MSGGGSYEFTCGGGGLTNGGGSDYGGGGMDPGWNHDRNENTYRSMLVFILQFS